MSSRTILPRQEIKRLDNTESRFPSVVRTGDSRKGNFTIKFDDTKTILFDNSLSTKLISYPTTLPISGGFRNVLTSSIITLGTSKNVAVGITNGLMQTFDSFLPFKENTFQELSLTNLDFYKTGSSLEILSGEFGYSIASKTAIRMEFPISASTSLQIKSASIYYYNKAHQKFDEVAPYNISPPYVLPSTGLPVVSIHDTKLFGPFGTPQLSGTQHVRAYQHSYDGSDDPASLKTYYALQTVSHTSSVLLDDRYLATNENTVQLSDYISHPFLLEKAAIEFPFAADSDWMLDQTTFQNNGENNFPDAGGPCITFSILNQNRQTGKRKIVLSGTVIPAADNVVERTTYISGAYQATYLRGFRNFGVPTAVISPNIGFTSFSGTVKMNCNAAIQNSVITFSVPPSIQTWAGSDFNRSFICAVDPYGRSQNSMPTGRGVTGGDFAFVDLTNIIDLGMKNHGTTPSAGTGLTDIGYSPRMYQLISNNSAPYLLYPGDEIIFTISKYRPILSVNPATFNSLGYSNGSHTTKINSGTLKLTLWGSLVKEAKEFHDTLNSAITTEAVHEMIGSETILDQLDLFDKEEFIGTYIDDFVSGTMDILSDDSSIDSTNTPSNARGKWYSSANLNSNNKFFDFKSRISEKQKALYELASFSRNIQISSQERYYDSIPPAIDDILIQTSHRLHAYPLFDEKTNKICTLAHFDQWGSSISNLTWTRSYPFEPAYSTCIRKMIDKFRSRNYYFNGSVGGYFGQPLNFDNNFVIYQTVNSTTSKLVLDKDGSEVTGMKNEDALKYLYGIGDENQCYEYNTVLFGATNRPSTLVSNVSASYGHAGVLLRGWKYGLINANPQYTKTHWKRDHFGYLRDMLEQRHDSKFYFPNGLSQGGVIGQSYIDNSPVAIKFVNVSGTIVRPEETYSSNLSFEATSSLPYFDGFVRNRESPLRTIGIQNFSYLE
jgi:hypothetical protein